MDLDIKKKIEMDSIVRSLVEADIAEVCHSSFPSIHLYICAYGYSRMHCWVRVYTILSLHDYVFVFVSFLNLDAYSGLCFPLSI